MEYDSYVIISIQLMSAVMPVPGLKHLCFGKFGFDIYSQPEFISQSGVDFCKVMDFLSLGSFLYH